MSVCIYLLKERNVVFYDDTQTSSSTCWWYTSTTLSGGTYTKVYQSKSSASADWIDESSTNRANCNLSL